jgi:hypothetical protein
MHKQSDIKVTKIDRDVLRPGFTGRFHCVTYEWLADGLVHSSFKVWISSAYSEAEAERVARTLLSPRLCDLAELAKAFAVCRPENPALRKRGNRSQSVGVQKRRREPSSQRITRHLERCHVSLVRYVLDGSHEPVPCNDLATWKAWMNTPERWVEDALLLDRADNQVRVCTVFLGLDLGFNNAERPILFETMVLGGIWDRALYRYCTWREAQEGHALLLRHLQVDDRATIEVPALETARNLAHRTVKTSEQSVVKAFIEQAASQLAR